ncbi:MAG: GNAT family N-acetyltransferase [Bacteriovoracaceae bacterium]|nr:GNAT family N-acetyltransferase [Bacteriovoracaceae bacterium]
MRRLVLKTSRLVLRPLRMSDYATWYEAYVNAREAQNKWDHGPMKKERCNKREFKKIVSRHRRLAQKDKCYIYGVFLKTRLIGMIDIYVYERGCVHSSNLGYRIFNHYWGRGFGQEAASAAIQIGHQQLKLQRLEAAIDLDNRRSLRLVRSIGMRREGIKKAYWFQEGRWDDQMVYVSNPK